MLPHPANRIHLFVKRVANERMREVEGIGMGSGPQQLGFQSFIDGGQRGLFVKLSDGGCDIEGKSAVEGSGNREQSVRVVGKLGQARTDYLAYSFGEAEFFDAKS